jgi:hypothetical protein
MSDAAMLVATSRDAGQLAGRDDVGQLSAELRVELYAVGDALAARLHRGLRRLVGQLSLLTVAMAAAAVFLIWAAR